MPILISSEREAIIFFASLIYPWFIIFSMGFIRMLATMMITNEKAIHAKKEAGKYFADTVKYVIANARTTSSISTMNRRVARGVKSSFFFDFLRSSIIPPAMAVMPIRD